VTKPTQRGLFSAALLIAGVTMGSKVLGAWRDWQIVTLFGTQLVTDAYYAGFQLPSFFLILLGGVGGPFHTATIAVVGPLCHNQQPTPQAQKVVQQLWWLTLGVSGVLALLAWSAATPICRLMLDAKASPAFVQQSAQQLKLMAPIIALGPLVGIACGLQNIAGQYFWPSFAPAMLSVVLLAATMVWPGNATVLALGTVGGAAAQLLAQLPDVWRAGWFSQLGRSGDAPLTATEEGTPTENPLRQLLHMVGPAIVGTTAGQCNVYVDIYFTSMLPQGGWTAIVQANRLIQLPIGVLQSALLVPIFPRFTQHVAEGNHDGLRQAFRLGISSLWVISLPLMAIILLHGQWLIALLFERGAFNAQSTQLVYHALLGLTPLLMIYFARDTLTRVFYAFKNTKTPLYVGLVAIVFNFVLDALLVKPYGVMGITLATTCVTLINGVVLAWWLNRTHLPGLGWRTMGQDWACVMLQTGVASAASWVTFTCVPLTGWVAHGVSLLVLLVVQAALLPLLPVPAARQLVQRFAKRG
jgi:putative peptidoglycan lipid II flippase